MKVKVVKKHQSNYPSPIHFEKGDRLTLGQLDTEFVGWVRVTTTDGNMGWAPVSFIESVSPDFGVANTDYDATELNTQLGEVLNVRLSLYEWYFVESQFGQLGWVPMTTVVPLFD